MLLERGVIAHCDVTRGGFPELSVHTVKSGARKKSKEFAC